MGNRGEERLRSEFSFEAVIECAADHLIVVVTDLYLDRCCDALSQGFRYCILAKKMDQVYVLFWCCMCGSDLYDRGL